MKWLRWLVPRTMAMQLFWVTVAGVVLTNVMGKLVSKAFPASWHTSYQFRALEASHRTVADLLAHVTTAEQQQAVVTAAIAADIPVRAVTEGEASAAPARGTEGDWLVPAIGGDGLLLVPHPVRAFRLLNDRTIYTLVGTACFLSLWLLYAIVAIMAPLSRFARIARAFGRSDGGDLKLPEKGAIEIRELAHALNDMRARIRMLVEARTRMLRSIGHDLRTPLTRLRLRVDRMSDADLKAAMLRDVELIDRMINKTLAYLRDGRDSEPEIPTDLPSLLGTICADFSDTGHDVIYRGPPRLTHRCRPEALSRAIGNLVENATKFGSHVVVTLASSNADVVIEVSDDGPGIKAQDRASVVEPFFRVDAARHSDARSGFGLGLAIVQEIVAHHNGRLSLIDNQPRGLLARISLPVAKDAAAPKQRDDFNRVLDDGGIHRWS